jgi:hypothetical protein
MYFGEGLSLGVGLGIIATLLSAFIAERNGFLQISFMRKAHELNVARALPRIGCQVFIEAINTLGPGYNPHIFIRVKLYNEGELAVQNIAGQWNFYTPDPSTKRVFPIQRDFLGKCQDDLYSYMIQESANWRREGIAFDVEVEFFYSMPGEQEATKYSARYYYHRESGQMVKRSYT